MAIFSVGHSLCASVVFKICGISLAANGVQKKMDTAAATDLRSSDSQGESGKRGKRGRRKKCSLQDEKASIKMMKHTAIVSCFCCNRPGEWYMKMLSCASCGQCFHEGCVKCLDQQLLFGDRFYFFLCAICNNGKEFIQRLELTWVDLIHLVLFHLTVEYKARLFDMDIELLPWINDNASRLQSNLLNKTSIDQRCTEVRNALNSNRDRFKNGNEFRKRTATWSLRIQCPPLAPVFQKVLPCSQGGPTDSSLNVQYVINKRNSSEPLKPVKMVKSKKPTVDEFYLRRQKYLAELPKRKRRKVSMGAAKKIIKQTKIVDVGENEEKSSPPQLIKERPRKSSKFSSRNEENSQPQLIKKTRMNSDFSSGNEDNFQPQLTKKRTRRNSEFSSGNAENSQPQLIKKRRRNSEFSSGNEENTQPQLIKKRTRRSSKFPSGNSENSQPQLIKKVKRKNSEFSSRKEENSQLQLIKKRRKKQVFSGVAKKRLTDRGILRYCSNNSIVIDSQNYQGYPGEVSNYFITSQKIGPSRMFTRREVNLSHTVTRAEVESCHTFTRSEVGPACKFTRDKVGPSCMITRNEVEPSHMFTRSQVGPARKFTKGEVGPFRAFTRSQVGPSCKFTSRNQVKHSRMFTRSSEVRPSKTSLRSEVKPHTFTIFRHRSPVISVAPGKSRGTNSGRMGNIDRFRQFKKLGPQFKDPAKWNRFVDPEHLHPYMSIEEQFRKTEEIFMRRPVFYIKNRRNIMKSSPDLSGSDVNLHFGAQSRLECGQKYEVKGRRIRPDGCIQYLVEWQFGIIA